MFVRRFILCLALLFGCLQSASATPACDRVDNVLRTLSTVQDFQTDTSERQYFETISQLKSTVSQISLPDLQPAAYHEAFPEGGPALALYISSLRAALADAGTGSDRAAKNILSQPVPPQLSNDINALNRYWGCQDTEAFEASGLTGPEQTTFKNETSASSLGAKDDTLSVPSPEPASTGQTAPVRTLAKSISNGPKLDIKGHPIVFIAMVLAIVAILYGWRKYSKRSRMRDHRHLIHRDTAFKIGKKQYQMTVIDITQKGLKFKHDGLIKRQRKVAIDLNGDWYKCRLVWKNANFAGAKFRTPLKDKTMDALLANIPHQE